MVEPEASSVTPGADFPKKRSHRTAAIVSCVLWVVSLILSFTIPPTSPYIWVPDVFLLIGFIPLLFSWSPSWPWLVFGFLNFAIGSFLLLLSCLDDAPFPKELHAGKHHIVEYHPWAPWMILGLLAALFGVGRITKNIVRWIIVKQKAKTNAVVSPDGQS